jgi:hypothetical protein
MASATSPWWRAPSLAGREQLAVEHHLPLPHHADLRRRAPGVNQVLHAGQSPRLDALGQGRPRIRTAQPAERQYSPSSAHLASTMLRRATTRPSATGSMAR